MKEEIVTLCVMRFAFAVKRRSLLVCCWPLLVNRNRGQKTEGSCSFLVSRSLSCDLQFPYRSFRYEILTSSQQ